MEHKKSNGRKAFILITSLLFATILVIIALPYVSRITTEYLLMTKIYASTAALDLAEAGIERGLWEINYNNSTFSGWGLTTGGDGSSTYTLLNTSLSTSSGSVIGYYDVSAWISSDGATATVTGIGYVPTKTNFSEKKTIKVTYAKHNFSMVIAAVGNTPGAITLGVQDKVDSYNSANGTYAQTHTNADGNIATNGSIVFGTQAKVYGDANPGADYPFSSKPSNVTGAWGTLQAPITLEPIPQSVTDTAHVTMTSNNNSNIVKGNSSDPSPLSGYALGLGVQKTATLPGGTYYFSSVTLNTQATLNVTGPSTIYVEAGNISVGTQANLNISATAPVVIYALGGDINVSTQGDINNYGAPRNLQIYSTGSQVNLVTQTDFYGSIYAPNAAVSLTTQGDIFGAVACKTFTGGTQAGLHFDMDLLNVSPVFAGNRVTSWQELKQ